MKLRLPHYPNHSYATLEDSLFIWIHITSFETKENLQFVKYGIFVYTDNLSWRIDKPYWVEMLYGITLQKINMAD